MPAVCSLAASPFWLVWFEMHFIVNFEFCVFCSHYWAVNNEAPHEPITLPIPHIINLAYRKLNSQTFTMASSLHIGFKIRFFLTASSKLFWWYRSKASKACILYNFDTPNKLYSSSECLKNMVKYCTRCSCYVELRFPLIDYTTISYSSSDNNQ